MTAAQALRYRLANTGGVTSLVSSRVYLTGNVPQDTPYPYITVFEVDSVGHHHFTAAAGLLTTRVQIDMYAREATAAYAIADAVRTALDGYRGTITVSTSPITLQMCHMQTQQINIDSPTGTEQSGLHRVTQDYMCAHAVSVPTFS